NDDQLRALAAKPEVAAAFCRELLEQLRLQLLTAISRQRRLVESALREVLPRSYRPLAPSPLRRPSPMVQMPVRSTCPRGPRSGSDPASPRRNRTTPCH